MTERINSAIIQNPETKSPSKSDAEILSPQEEEKLKSILNDGRLHNPPKEPFILLDEKEGLKRLYSFLYLNWSFDNMNPFVLHVGEKKPCKNKTNPSYKFNLPKGFSNDENGKSYDKRIYIHIPSTEALASRTIWAIPRTLTIGHTPYYWLECYNPDSQDNDILPFTAGRLYPNQTSKTDFVRWHGIEEELAADFIEGKNNIHFEDLESFQIRNIGPKTARYLIAGRNRQNPGLTLKNPLLNQGDNVLCIPTQDEQKLYNLLSLYKVIENESIANFPHISTYLIYPQSHTLTALWPGVEKQLLLDYIAAIVRKIDFPQLKPIKFIVGKFPTKNFLRCNGKNIILNLSTKFNLHPNDIVTLEPEKENETTAYFLLKKDNETLTRYALDRKQNTFSRMDISEEQTAQNYVDSAEANEWL